MESLRPNAVIHEIEPSPEIDFSPSAATDSRTGSEEDFLATLQLLSDKRQLLFRVALWACVVSVIIAFLIPSEYESTVRIMPPDSMNSAGSLLTALLGKGNGGELAAMAGSLFGVKGSGALFVDLFRSRSVQDRVIDRVNLQKVYWSRYKEDARKRLNRNTDVSEDRKSDVITLVVTDRDPRRARDIAQAYVEELNSVVAHVSTSSARRQRIFVEQRLESVKVELENAEKDFSAFASKNTTLDIKEQTKAMVESAATLQGQLIATQSELQGLEQIYTDNNVRVRALRARIDELQHQLEKIRGADSSLIPDSSEADQLYPSIRKLPLLGVEWADLYRRVKVQETVFELLTQQYELARIQEAKEIPTVNVVDPPNVPERKSGPYRSVIVLVLVILSLAGTVAIILWTERIRSMDPDNPRRQLAMKFAEVFAQLRGRIGNLRFRRRSDSSGRAGSDPE